MNKLRFSAALLACCAILIASTQKLRAAELRLLAGGAMAGIWTEMKPQFEQASGHKLDIFFGTTPNLIKEATSGKPFDLAVVPAEVMQDATARAKFVAGPSIDIARVGLGVAVRSGAAKPDISTPEALKATLLKAESVASIPESATGYSIARAFERMGIAEQMKAKTKSPPAGGFSGELLLSGEAELAVQQKPELMHVAGTEIVGFLPGELNMVTEFAAAIMAGCKQPQTCKSLIAMLRSPDATAVFRSKGLEPR